MPPRLLAELRQPDIGRLLSPSSILIQPVGAIEQHGPHLPFNTDTVIAEATASAAVEAVGDDLDLWLLPTMAYSKSNEHAWSAGTMWLSATTMLAVLGDLGRCVARTPARRLVFLNGHGGNSSLLNVACRDIRLETGLMTFLAHPGVPADQGGASPGVELGMGIHGGADESSVMAYLRPDLCVLSAGFRNIPEPLAANRHVRFGGRITFGWLSNDFGPLGHIGDPTSATPERGRELFEESVRLFVEGLEEIARFDFGRRWR